MLNENSRVITPLKLLLFMGQGATFGASIVGLALISGVSSLALSIGTILTIVVLAVLQSQVKQ